MCAKWNILIYGLGKMFAKFVSYVNLDVTGG